MSVATRSATHWLAFAWTLGLASSIAPRAAADTIQQQGSGALGDYYSGNGFLNRGLHDLAAEEYRRFLLEHDGHAKAPVARYGLAVSLFRLKRYDEAITELTQLREASTTVHPVEVAVMLGQCHLARRAYAQAAEAFDEVLDQHGEHDLVAEASVGAAEALYALGRYDEVTDRCKKLVANRPKSKHRDRAEFFWGLADMAQGNFSAAGKRLSALLERSPRSPFADQASLLLAQCYDRQRLVDPAIRQYRKVLARSGTHYLPDALLGLATLLRQERETKEAGSLLDRLLEKFPKSSLGSTALFERGRVAFDRQDFSKAAKLFARAAEIDKGIEDAAAYWMAKCKLRQGDFADAAQRLASAIEGFSGSALQPQMRYDRAVALVRAGDYEKGLAVLGQFRRRFPDHALFGESLHLSAVAGHQLGRYEQSRKHCRAFLKGYPSHELAPAVLHLSAENDFLSGKFAQACKSYSAFLKQYPKRPEVVHAKHRLGTALYRLDKFDEALPLLTSVAARSGSDETLASAWLALGDIYFRRGEWKPAERALRAYLAAGFDVSAADDALLKLGLCQQRQGSFGQAVQTYEELIARFDDSAHRLQAEFERGQALVQLERADEAAEAFEQVLARGGDSRFAAYARNHLGAISLRRGDFDAAVEHFENIADDHADADLTADALLQRGQALVAAQRYAEAQQTFSKFLERFPKRPQAGRARAQLAITLSRQDLHTEALATIEQVEQAGSAALTPALHLALRYEKAWCLRQLGRTDDSAAVYRGIVKRDAPSTLTVHSMLDLAAIEAEAKRWSKAERLLKRLSRWAKDDAVTVASDVLEQAGYRLAICQFELERFDTSADSFERFIADFPNSDLLPSASFYCGEALVKIGRHERAVGHFARVAKDYHGDTACGPSLLRLGECLAVLQRWPDSERVLADYLDRFGNSDAWYQAQFGVGWAVENQERFSEAIAAYGKVVARHKGPTAARAQFQIGECLFARKQYKEAARELLKVDILYGYPEWSAAALYEAGRSFEKLGMLVEARAQFRSVSDKYGESRWSALASKRLSESLSSSLPGR